MGNVAIDVLRWLLQDSPTRQTEEVIVVARRGPFEAKFGEKEIAHVEMHLARDEFLQELERVKDRCAVCNQEASAQKVGEATFPFLNKPDLEPVPPKVLFRFLSSPKEIIPGPDGRIRRLVLTENDLVLSRDGNPVARASEKSAVLDVDTMIFAIGDKHDPKVGLPMGPAGYATLPNPADPKQPVYELYDPGTGKLLEGFYVVGWARRASDGLVGIARHDGEVGAAKVLDYLKTAPPKPGLPVEKIQTQLEARGIRLVTKSDLELLGRAEAQAAQARGLSYFKYSDDESMLRAIVEQKAKLKANGAVADASVGSF
jgi:ferredoxin--NADP+ reductase